jgi:hypothetical protein
MEVSDALAQPNFLLIAAALAVVLLLAGECCSPTARGALHSAR